jgi:hypothetical protein
MEIRHVVFTEDEIRRLIGSFIGKQGHGRQQVLIGTEIIGHDDAPAVVARLSTGAVNIPATDLVSALLLHCRNHRIPIPQRSQKKVQRWAGGLALVVTTDVVEGGAPIVVDDQIIYGDTTMALELKSVKEQLAHAIARAEDAERKLTGAAKAVTIALHTCDAAPQGSGLRARIVRLLTGGKQPVS